MDNNAEARQFLKDADAIDWTEKTLTRDFYPSRTEYFLKDILCGMLSRTAPKDEEKCIAKAMRYTKLVEDALDAAQD